MGTHIDGATLAAGLVMFGLGLGGGLATAGIGDGLSPGWDTGYAYAPFFHYISAPAIWAVITGITASVFELVGVIMILTGAARTYPHLGGEERIELRVGTERTPLGASLVHRF